jgi:[CysO sulfur-carrier protein]-S-L-cysteine hydrolase
MLNAARAEPNQEVCGLLAGRDGTITNAFPATNALASATKYEIDPPEILKLIREIREQNMEFIGIYHSHPNTDNSPSQTDIERAYYPEAAYLIISPKPDAPKPIRAFQIRDGKAKELLLEEVF